MGHSHSPRGMGQQVAPGLGPQGAQGEFCKVSHGGCCTDQALLLNAVGANGCVLTFPVEDGIPLSGTFCRPRPPA